MSHVKITGFYFYLISQYSEKEGLSLSDSLDFFNLICVTIIYYSLEIHMQIRDWTSKSDSHHFPVFARYPALLQDFQRDQDPS